MVDESAASPHARGGQQLAPRSPRRLPEARLGVLREGRRAAPGVYTILRPFNGVASGTRRSRHGRHERQREVALSHVVPDLVLKCPRQNSSTPGGREQVRSTYGGDLARGIRLAMESGAAINEDFNLSTPTSTTVLELARLIWRRLRPDRPFRWVSDPPFDYDVQHRVPDVRKARDVLGFEATTGLAEMLDEVIPWIRAEDAAGTI